LYFAKANTTAPSAPTATVTTNSSTTYATWNKAMPAYSENYPYYFTCVETLYTDGTYKWSTPVYAAALTTANQTASNAKTAASSANSTANTANTNLSTHTNNTTIHVTQADKDNWNAKSTFSGKYSDLSEKPTLIGKSGTGTGSEVFNNTQKNIASGSNAHAEGYITTASGNNSHAESYQTTASGDHSHAEGYLTTALGAKSHAEGMSNSRKHDITTSTDDTEIQTAWKTSQFSLAKGEASHVEGKNNLALGDTSHAEGLQTIASGSYSHVEGWNTTSSNKASHAEGYGTTASGTYSHAEGNSTNRASSVTTSTSNNEIQTAWETNKFSLAKGDASHVEGKDNLALGSYSHAEGYQTTASGAYSHAEGNGTKATNASSHAEGYYTSASGNDSHAEGYYAAASGSFSHAEGGNTKASGSFSHTEGNGTTASGSNSHAEGIGTKASSDNQHAQGKYNIEDTSSKYAHIVGNGESNGVRSNAHTLDWNGKAWFKNDVCIGGTGQDSATASLSAVKTIADTANSNASSAVTTANEAKTLAEGALPLSGGTMTGPIIMRKGSNSDFIVPETNSTGNIGNSNKKFHVMYANTFIGNLAGTAKSMNYGTCNTADSTAQKDVTLSIGLYNGGNNSTFSLSTGTRIVVQFTYANTVPNPTLKVSSTNAKPIYYCGKALTEDMYWKAGAVIDFIYIYASDAFEIVGISNDSNNSNNSNNLDVLRYGTFTVTDDTGTLDVTIPDENFKLEAGVRVLVNFKFDYKMRTTGVYLNVNNTGAKRVKWRGKFLEYAPQYNATMEFVYDGTYWITISEPYRLGVLDYYGGVLLGDPEENSVTDLNTYSYGQRALVYGYGNKAIANNAFAGGNRTCASGDNSWTQGYGTIAKGKNQFAQGVYNIEDTENKYAHIVGNGSWDVNNQVANRSNAHTLDWEGHGWYSGALGLGGT
jgi:hypothetical protein